MSDANKWMKDIGNLVYTGLLTAAGTIASRKVITSNISKDRPINNFDMKSVAMLTGDVVIASAAVGTLQEKNLIPRTIFT